MPIFKLDSDTTIRQKRERMKRSESNSSKKFFKQIVRFRLNISGLQQYMPTLLSLLLAVVRIESSSNRIETHDASSRLIERGHSSMK